MNREITRLWQDGSPNWREIRSFVRVSALPARPRQNADSTEAGWAKT
jgi:hypothetical protein